MRKSALALLLSAFLLVPGPRLWANAQVKNADDKVTVVDGIRHFGPAWLMKHNGIYVMYVEGDNYEMGYQHGVLMREEIGQGMLPYMSGYFRREIEHSVIGGISPLVNAAVWFFNHFFFDRIAGRTPEYMEEGLAGLTDAAGLEYADLHRLLVFADVGQTTEGKVYGKEKIYPGLKELPDFGCTSFIAAGKATANGHLLHGRNLDFPGLGWFDKYPTIIFCKPKTGQRYVMFTSAGMHTAGATALNESGLMMGFHTVITADVGMSGMPILPLGEKVIREARTLEEAIQIFREHPTAAGWIGVISDAKRKTGVAVEINNKRSEIISMTDETLAVANSYRNPENQQAEMSTNWSYPINSLHRQRRMNQLLEKNHGLIDPQMGAEFLSDHYDLHTQRERATGDVIAQVSNVQSVVVDSTDMNFWVALCPGQTGIPVCNCQYAGFNFFAGFNREFPELPVLHGVWEKNPKLNGIKHFTDAGNKFDYEDDLDGAIQELKAAMSIDPDEPVYAELAGLLYVREVKAEEAAAMFGKALSMPQTAHKQSIGHLWLGRAYDLMNKRDAAVDEYKKVSSFSPLDPRVKEAAAKGLKKNFTAREAGKISVDFGSGDSYGY